jgi:hypothetical protein
MWRRLKLLGRAMFRSAGVGVVLERQRRESSQLSNGDSFRPAEGDSLRVLGGSSTVTVVGRPSELMLFASGRMGAADVALVGEPVAVRTLATGDRRI